MQESHATFRPFLLTLVFLPIFAYFLCAWQYSLNIPSWDDYDFLEDALEIKNSNSLGDKIAVVFSQEGEHRTAFIRIIFLLQQIFSGEIDFQVLALLGNTALFGLLFIFYKNLPGFRFKLLSLIPVVLFLFQFQNWNNMIWTTGALHHFPILYFSGGAFYWLVKKSKGSFVSALAHAFIAAFTHGSGLAVAPLGALYLLGIKRTRDGFIWLGCGILILLLFFYDYQFPAQGSSPGAILQSPGLLAARFFSFLGSILAFKQFYLSVALGVVIFAYFIFLTREKYYLKNPVIYFFMVFLVLSALAASLFRSGLGADQALTYRYKIYSAVFWILAYLSFLEFSASKNLLTPKLLAAFIFPAAVIYMLSIVDTYPKLAFQKNMLTYRINHWAINNNGLFFHDQKAANRILGAAIEQGIYHPPSHLLTLAKKEQSQVIKDSNICRDVSEEKIDAKLNGFALGEKPYLYRLEGMIYDSPEIKVNPVPIYFVLKSASQRLLVTTRRQEIPQMSVHFRKGSRNTGVLSLIAPQYLDGGPFQVGLCYQNKVTFYDFHAALPKLKL